MVRAIGLYHVFLADFLQQGEILRGRDPGYLMKFVVEVAAVGVAVHVKGFIQVLTVRLQNFFGGEVETLDALKLFGRQTYVAGEYSAELALAEACGRGQFVDVCSQVGRQQLECLGKWLEVGRVLCADNLSENEVLNDVYTRLRCLSLKNAAFQLFIGGILQTVKVYIAVGELAARDAHDYGNGVGIEEYSNHLYVFERTDVDGFLVQSDHRGLQSGICRPVHFEGGLPVEDPSREPGGHDELGHVRFACLHNPIVMHEGAQRHGGNDYFCCDQCSVSLSGAKKRKKRLRETWVSPFFCLHKGTDEG